MIKPTNKKELNKKPIKQKKDTSRLDVSFFVFMMFSTLSIRSKRLRVYTLHNSKKQ